MKDKLKGLMREMGRANPNYRTWNRLMLDWRKLKREWKLCRGKLLSESMTWKLPEMFFRMLGLISFRHVISYDSFFICFYMTVQVHAGMNYLVEYSWYEQSIGPLFNFTMSSLKDQINHKSSTRLDSLFVCLAP